MMPPTLCDACRSIDITAELKILRERFRKEDGEDPSLNNRSPASKQCIRSPWNKTIYQVALGADQNNSRAFCPLCSLVLRGWRASRARTVADALKSADTVNPDRPPLDFARDVLNIKCFGPAEGATVAVALEPRRNEVEDGRGERVTALLQFTCKPAMYRSWEANYALVAEFRVSCDAIEVIGHSSGEEAVEEEQAAGAEIDSTLRPDPMSEAALGISTAWLSNCVRNHGRACGRQIRDANGEMKWPGLPSRILDVGERGDTIYLRLRESILTPDSDAEPPPYVALSHCWGILPDPFCTTKETMNKRKEGIAISEMPKTFRDAVMVTRALSLRYLWIDSLCIIQQDEEDWVKEAADMSNIYQYCHLLLGAARGSSDAEGFLQMRTETEDEIVLTPGVKGKGSTGAAGDQYSLHLLPPAPTQGMDTDVVDPLAREPLNRRAWCLQERMLPARSLFYGTSQMYWECRVLRAGEDGGATASHVSVRLEKVCRTAIAPISVFRRRIEAQHKEMDEEGKREEEKQESEEEDHSDESNRDRDEAEEGRDEELEESYGNSDHRWIDWYKMVEEYSTRSLTKDDDRLVALGGLARFVANSSGGDSTYLAGIWGSGLIEGLAWSRKQPPSPRGQRSIPSADYVAPTWSWASVVGPVRFLMYAWYERAAWKYGYSNFEPLAELVGRRIEPRRGEDEYGRLRDGSLTLRASLLTVTAVRPRQTTPLDTEKFLDMVPSQSPVTDRVLCLKQGSTSTSIWVEGGFDDPSSGRHGGNTSLFVVFLSRLAHVGSSTLVSEQYRFLEHRFGLIVQKTAAQEEGGGPMCYRRVGFVDGFVLRRRLFGGLSALFGSDSKEFETVSYPCAPPHVGFDSGPENLRAPDPLGFECEDLILV